VLASACSRAPASPDAKPVPATLDKVWLLETSGPPVADTAVTFAARTGRTVVMHHAAPDDAIFLELKFAPATDSLRARDSIHVSIHPVPGKYAFTLATPDKLTPGTEATFSYAIHFRTPADAIAKYPSPERFEQLLYPANLTGDNRVLVLTGTRPGADLLSFPVTAPGTYALAAPR
jgi:hypothetical protein